MTEESDAEASAAQLLQPAPDSSACALNAAANTALSSPASESADAANGAHLPILRGVLLPGIRAWD